jgi:hypothetical protein
MKTAFLGITIGTLIGACVMWEIGLVSPKTGPYWTCPMAVAGVLAILYAGTKEE